MSVTANRAFAVAALMLLTGCDDPKTARHALDNAGYSDIQVGGYDFFMCGKDDDFATKFTARNPAGRLVSGAVCSSWFGKGATIRF
jgi:hypothetical protein